MKVLVLGYTESGKDTSSQIITDFLKCNKFMACSDVIIPEFAKSIGISEELIRENKTEYRQQLYEYGIERQKTDPKYPTTEILEQTDVLNGIRTIQQFEASKHLFDFIIWINRDGITKGSTDELDSSVASIIVNNSGTIEELKNKLLNIISLIEIDWDNINHFNYSIKLSSTECRLVQITKDDAYYIMDSVDNVKYHIDKLTKQLFIQSIEYE